MNYRTYFSGALTAVRYIAERGSNVPVKLFVQSFEVEQLLEQSAEENAAASLALAR